MIPSLTQISTTTPLYASKAESKINALSGASISPDGGAIYETTCSNISLTPTPVFAEANTASYAGIPTTSWISFLVPSGSADGRSTLLINGNISRSLSKAK